MTEPARAGTRADARFLAILVGLTAIPLVAAAVALRRPPWAPVLDLAMTELRVRDVGGSHTPLIGLPGRIGDGGEQGSHPGPLSFWLLAPGYRAFGSTPWGLHLATALLDVVAIGLSLTFAHRLAGRRGAVAVALIVSLLVIGYGVAAVVEPWNPYLPLLWWVAFLVAVWGSLQGDRPAIVLLVVAGSLCAQTHVPYLGLGGLLGALGLAGAWWRSRDGGRDERRSLWRWTLVAAAVTAVLWTPLVVDQLTNDPGNLRLLSDHFASPPEQPIGFAQAGGEVLEHFDLGHLVVDQVRTPGLLTRGELGRFPVAWRGAVLVGTWLLVAALAWRRSPWSLRALQVVVGAGTLVGWYSISRIFGVVWYYLMLWLWALPLLAVAAIVWALFVLRGPPERQSEVRAEPSGRAVAPAIALLALLALRAAITAPDAAPSDDRLSLVLRALVPDTVAALDRGVGPATGRDGRYLVGFDDALHIGSQAYGLVAELERAGFDARMSPASKVPITEHRTIAPADATARVELVTGIHIEEWRALPGAVEVALVDLRTPEERRELQELRAEAVARLHEERLDELIPLLDTNVFAAAIDPRASQELQVTMDRILRIGVPTAIFVAPPETTVP